jgi:hypothetical protein
MHFGTSYNREEHVTGKVSVAQLALGKQEHHKGFAPQYMHQNHLKPWRWIEPTRDAHQAQLRQTLM